MLCNRTQYSPHMKFSFIHIYIYTFGVGVVCFFVCLVAKSCLSPWDCPGKNTGVELLLPSPGDLPDPGIKPMSPALARGFFYH